MVKSVINKPTIVLADGVYGKTSQINTGSVYRGFVLDNN